MMSYRRPPNNDFANASVWEQEVRTWLPMYVDDRTSSTTELDFYVPGFFIECKEKNQPIGPRWPLPCAEPDAFILDELGIRKGLKHYPNAYFVMHDVPMGRVFVARIDVIALAECCRVNRIGKGKRVVDLTNFKQLLDPKVELFPFLLQDQLAMAWKNSDCLTQKAVPQA